tara:strand:+ start:1518 stop:1736 length:219 start_codon:yes stop_codon:yes gene_type:complete
MMENQLKEAKVIYLDGDYELKNDGNYVKCAVSGKNISLHDLQYWSVELQEPYASSEFVVKKYQKLLNKVSES